MDLFSGVGGMTVGLEEAARRQHRRLQVDLAIDLEPRIAQLFKRNFPKARVAAANVGTFFPGEPGQPLGPDEQRIAAKLAEPDFLVAGPPCQGHSDLNNHTRRTDPKNALYLKVARATEILLPSVVVIENVQAVQHDRGDVVVTTAKALVNSGYTVDSRVLDLADLGVAQRRRRFVLIASRHPNVSPTRVFDRLTERWSGHPHRHVDWAIRDLEQLSSTELIDSRTELSPDSIRRIDYLFDNCLYELPDSERPPCHRDKPHSYTSVYGRLSWSRPAPTITSGFGSMGQGRYVHPSQRRTLTPHEAARLQGFPDWFTWERANRSTLATTIGNAVPPQLMAEIGSIVIPQLREES